MLGLLVGLLAASPVSIDVKTPGPWVLGRTQSLQLEIKAPEPPGPLRPLRLSSNIGSFDEVKRVEPGRYTVNYKPPSTRHPQVAVIALWRETGPDAEINFSTIDLWGKTDLPLVVRPRAQASVVVGDQTYGPVKADRRGRVKVPIEVPPGVLQVSVRAVSGKRRSELAVPVEVPPYNRLALAVTPYKVPADGASVVTVHAYYVGDAPDTISLKAAQGKLTKPVKKGSRFVARFTPSRQDKVDRVKLQARAADKARSSAKVVLQLGRPVADSILVRALEPFYAGSDERRIEVLALDRAGLAVEGLQVSARTNTATLAPGREVGQGAYELRLKPPAEFSPEPVVLNVVAARPGDTPVKVEARLPIETPPWPKRFELKGAPSIWFADPHTTHDVEVVPLDARDRPVVGRDSELRAEGAQVALQKTEDKTKARITPTSDARALTLTLTDTEGPAVVRRFALRRHPGRLGVSAFGGLHVHQTPLMGGGLAVSYRPRVLERRLSVEASGAVELLSRELTLLDTSENVQSSLLHVPMQLGLRYDFLQNEYLNVYGLARAGVGLWSSSVTLAAGDVDDSGLSVLGSGGVGVECFGVYLEAEARGLSLRSDATSLPSFGFGARLGYRLNVL